MVELYFLNLPYWYCVIYSLFGGGCTYLDQLREAGVDVPFDGVSAGVDTASQGPGFFERVFDSYSGAVSAVWDPISGVLSFMWNTYSAIAFTVSGMLAFAIFAALLGLFYIRFRELYTYGTVAVEEKKKDDPRRNKWDELLEHAKSTDPKSWRHAILEADLMLGELLGNLGYKGVNTAEKMRGLPEDAFVTVPVAWEAHRVRNFVSQGASDFILTQREAFRVMKLYEQVFEEFGVV